MILFKQEHVKPILQRLKTETRRGGKKRWNVGAVHQCRTRMLDGASTFALVRIIGVERQRLRDMSEAAAKAEGYENVWEYWAAWERINKRADLDEEVWAVRFELL